MTYPSTHVRSQTVGGLGGGGSRTHHHLEAFPARTALLPVGPSFQKLLSKHFNQFQEPVSSSEEDRVHPGGRVRGRGLKNALNITHFYRRSPTRINIFSVCSDRKVDPKSRCLLWHSNSCPGNSKYCTFSLMYSADITLFQIINGSFF